MQSLKALFRQPKSVFLLSFVQMWNRFSHYGMRALLVLFMLHALKFSTPFALGVYAVFCALVELGGVLGAYLAQKTFGLRRAILYGGWIVALGHLSLAMKWFFPGLALLIVGSSLFSTNITALIGEFYQPQDVRRQGGFTLFYMGINVGALLATILCGFLAENFGWEYGFGLAAAGMVLGNLALLKFRHLLSGKGETPEDPKKGLPLLLIGLGGFAILCMVGQSISLPLLPILAVGLGILIFRKLRKQNIPLKGLALSLVTLVLFFAAEEQIGSSLVVFTSEKTTHTLFGLPMATSSILSLNPIVIIFFGAIANALYLKIKNPSRRLAIPFLIVAGALALLSFSHMAIPILPLSSVMGVVALISFAELLVGPMVYTTCSEVSSAAKDPKVMGLVPIGFSLAALLGGTMSKFITATGYDLGFLVVAAMVTLFGIGLGGLQSKIKPATSA